VKWLEITITTTPAAVEAVGDLLYQSRVGGIQEIPLGEDRVGVRAYVPAGPATGATLDAIRAGVASLSQFGLSIGEGAVETAEVDEEAWAEAWKAHVRAFAVGRRLWITPTWDRTPPPAGAVVVEIDPGMAFGSGLHASTQLCLEVLDEMMAPGATVVDVGTGSGILAIAAARLGAAHVLAVDTDPVAVAVARQNVAHNGMVRVVEVQENHLLTGVRRPADVILANLTADLHLVFLPDVRPRLALEGIVAASGITAPRLPDVERAARASGLTLRRVMHSGEWRCLVLAAEA
jgi:ribosomal protein L11 methyltransferase